MILREIKNIFIKNRLTEGVDFKRYEWLKGDGSARISIIFNGYRETLNYTILLESSPLGLIYQTYVKISDTDAAEYAYFIGAGLELTLRHGIRRNNYSSFIDTKRDGTYEDHVYNISLKKGNVDNKVIFTINGSGFNKDSRFDSTLDFDASMLIYAKAAKISAFNTDRYNLTPCQLLKPIPATLDANNKARVAGECGMYDSISGKFFGNVASSGTFTVEGDVEPETHSGLQQIYQNKLIEGVDYETADWLKADIPISTNMMSLPINSKNFEFKRNWIQLMNSAYFSTSSSNSNYLYHMNDYGEANDLHPLIWDRTTRRVIFTSSMNVGLGIHTIIANDDKVTINSTTSTASLPWYGNPKAISFNNSSNINKNTIHLTSSIKVDGVTRYVPCQLLRSIPRNLDAQCKARQVGECGMIDLISGKFYGNVASSGTFTVENDSNE